MHAALLVEIRYRSVNIPAGKLFHSLLKFWFLLPDDLMQTCSVHPRFLELPIGSARFYRLMLPLVPDQEHTVASVQAMQQLVHLFCARETRFVQDVKPLLFAVLLLTADQMPLQGTGFDA